MLPNLLMGLTKARPPTGTGMKFLFDSLLDVAFLFFFFFGLRGLGGIPMDSDHNFDPPILVLRPWEGFSRFIFRICLTFFLISGYFDIFLESRSRVASQANPLRGK